jgi:DNA polymerase
VLGTTGKDPEGTNLIRKLTVPHTPTKLNPSYRWTPATAWEDFKKLYKYNDQDVLAEDEVSAHIPDLTPYELATWITDQTINARGMLFDIETLNASLDVLAQAGEKYNAELKALTGGLVKTVNQNKKFIEWVQSRGVHTRSVDEEHREELLKGYLPPDVHRALDIARLIMGANIKKLKSIKLQLSSDNRLRNQYVYCGADRTGRWSGPMQSLTAEGPQTAECESCGRFFGVQKACPHCGSLMFHVLPEWGNGAVRQAKRDIRTKSLEYIEQIWVSPIEVLTGCIRGLIIPKPEHKFICCDFSAVEAVVAACVSRCQWRIDVFSTHGKIYEESAARATGISFEEILAYKKEHGRHHPVRNGIGKIRELAGGYGGWIGAWKNFGAEKYFNNDGEIKADVLKWREESPEIVDMWGGQYRGYNQPELFGLEGAFIKAILNPGTNHQVNDFTISVEGDTLYMQLPSGRYLYYHEPRLIETHDKMGRPAWKITFMGYNTQTKKGPKGWIRQETYGGRIFQNGVQAVAGDIHAEALTRCEQNNYPIVLDTHDEALAEVPDSPIYTLQRMVDLLEIRPYWASWWPIKATGWEAYEYGK